MCFIGTQIIWQRKGLIEFRMTQGKSDKLQKNKNSQTIKTKKQEKEEKLAQALRDNLRRRKVAQSNSSES